ncbi:SprT family zinc-dependent metalloprotease [Hyphomonas sp.]|uniref:M48 family metallopeptidase n=1 Tax=Hyphomonas sp. TaxID=87 RepID=UPI0025B7CA42|nr:SprT family zinc-dependent metalloprotease [Hyphomonas sp.]
MTLRAAGGHRIKVRLEVNAKARRLIIRLDERRREAVAVAPSSRQIEAAAAFAAERVDWISTRLQHLPEITRFEDGEIFQYKGEDCQISLEGEGRIARLYPGEPRILSVPGDPETTQARVVRFLKKQAKADLTRAVTRYSEILKVAPKGISVKDTRSRWGSCTADGQLAFSWRLVMAPPEVLNYVAAHECAHLREMNHSARFWAHVARCCPDWQRQRAWLRLHGTELQAAGE